MRAIINVLVALATVLTHEFVAADTIPDSFHGTWILSSGFTSDGLKAMPATGSITKVLESDAVGTIGVDGGDIDTRRLGLEIKHIKIPLGGSAKLNAGDQEYLALIKENVNQFASVFLTKNKQILFDNTIETPDAEILIIGGQKAGLGAIEGSSTNEVRVLETGIIR